MKQPGPSGLVGCLWSGVGARATQGSARNMYDDQLRQTACYTQLSRVLWAGLGYRAEMQRMGTNATILKRGVAAMPPSLDYEYRFIDETQLSIASHAAVFMCTKLWSMQGQGQVHMRNLQHDAPRASSCSSTDNTHLREEGCLWLHSVLLLATRTPIIPEPGPALHRCFPSACYDDAHVCMTLCDPASLPHRIEQRILAL